MITDTQPTPKPRKPLTGCASPNYGKVDVLKALEMRAKQISWTDIGKVFGVQGNAVSMKVQKYLDHFPDIEQIQEFAEVEKQIQDGIRMKYALRMADDNVVKACSGPQAAMIYGILHDKRFPQKGAQLAVTIDVTLNSLIGNVHPPALHDIVFGHAQGQADSGAKGDTSE